VLLHTEQRGRVRAVRGRRVRAGPRSLAYHVTQPAIHTHITRGVARLAAVERPVLVHEPPPGRVPCEACDTPHLTCFACIARYVIGCDTGLVRTEQRWRGQVPGDVLGSRELPHAVNLKHVARHHSAGEGWHLSGNPLFSERDDEDD